MALGIGRTIGTAVACAALALLGAGCGSEAKPRSVETIPPGPDVSPPAAAPSSPLPAPSASVNPAAGCVNRDQVIEALIFADPDSVPPPQTTLTSGPVCEAGWAYTAVGAPGAEEARVVLRHTQGKWQVLTYGSAPCAEPRVAEAPVRVRMAAGC